MESDNNDDRGSVLGSDTDMGDNMAIHPDRQLSGEEVDEYIPRETNEEEFCIYCRAELPHTLSELCAKTEQTEPESLAGVIEGMADLIPTEPGVRGRPPIDNGAEMKDPISTGRKRAAIAAPIKVGMICEWAYLSNAGGGVEPIKGCTGYPATDRHHGPNKATLDNTTVENPAEDGTWNLHRICAMCITGETRLLTSDLRWVRADQISPGTKLWAFSEELGGPFEESEVLSVKKVIEPARKLILENGDEFTVSHNHQWVTQRKGSAHLSWKKTEDITIGTKLKKIVSPWEIENSYEEGWMGGFLDGEGSYNYSQLNVGQTVTGYNALILDQINTLFEKFTNGSYSWEERNTSHDPQEWWRATNTDAVMNIIGRTRPTRILQKYIDQCLNGKDGRKTQNAYQRGKPVKVIYNKKMPEQEFYSIETTSKTYIAEGYMSHNCHNRWHSANDKHYNEPRPSDNTIWLPVSEYKHHDPESKMSKVEAFMLEATRGQTIGD